MEHRTRADKEIGRGPGPVGGLAPLRLKRDDLLLGALERRTRGVVGGLEHGHYPRLSEPPNADSGRSSRMARAVLRTSERMKEASTRSTVSRSSGSSPLSATRQAALAFTLFSRYSRSKASR
jgi:hypothetical protein